VTVLYFLCALSLVLTLIIRKPWKKLILVVFLGLLAMCIFAWLSPVGG
jgi:hypothetical protein